MSISGIFHEEKVIGAGFNLYVPRVEEEEEEESPDAVEPLDWHNCAANKANAAEDEVCGDTSCTSMQNTDGQSIRR